MICHLSQFLTNRGYVIREVICAYSIKLICDNKHDCFWHPIATDLKATSWYKRQTYFASPSTTAYWTVPSAHMDPLPADLSFSESLLESAFFNIPTTSDASTSTDNSLSWDATLGITTTTVTNRGRKGLLFDGRKFTLKFQRKCGISTWRCSTQASCKAIATAEVRGTDTHILEMSAHTCTPITSEEASKQTRIRSVVQTTNGRSTRHIATKLNVPYNTALYMRRRRALAKQTTEENAS